MRVLTKFLSPFELRGKVRVGDTILVCDMDTNLYCFFNNDSQTLLDGKETEVLHEYLTNGIEEQTYIFRLYTLEDKPIELRFTRDVFFYYDPQGKTKVSLDYSDIEKLQVVQKPISSFSLLKWIKKRIGWF